MRNVISLSLVTIAGPPHLIWSHDASGADIVHAEGQYAQSDR